MIDCTAAQDVAEYYPEWLARGINERLDVLSLEDARLNKEALKAAQFEFGAKLKRTRHWRHLAPFAWRSV